MNLQKGLWQCDLGSAWPKFTQQQSGIIPDRRIFFNIQYRSISQNVTRQYSALTFKNASQADQMAYHPQTKSARQHENLMKRVQSQYSVFGVGQGMVDYSFSVDAADLQHCNAIEGGRRTISSQEAGQLLQYFKNKGREIKGSGGGSLNNTMVLLTNLRSATSHFTRPYQTSASYDFQPLNFMGMVNSNFYDLYYPDLPLSDHIRAISPWNKTDSTTAVNPTNVTKNEDPISGTVIVLVAEKGERSFLSDPNFGMQNFQITDDMIQQLQRSSWMFIEGYMLEHKEVVAKLDTLLNVAKEYGVSVALSAGDVSIVNKAAPEFWRILTESKNDGSPLVDALFANAVEGQALVSHAPIPVQQQFNTGASMSQIKNTQGSGESNDTEELSEAKVIVKEQLHKYPAAQASAYLANFASIVSITDGSSGSYISQQEAQPSKQYAQVFSNDVSQMEALDWYETGAFNVFSDQPSRVEGGHVITTAIPPAPADVVVDTCGAGDAYAAGFLFALMTSQDAVFDIAKLQNVGTFAAEVAAVVVGLSGTLPKWGCSEFQRLTKKWKEEQVVGQFQQQKEELLQQYKPAMLEVEQVREQLEQERLQVEQESNRTDTELQRQAEQQAKKQQQEVVQEGKQEVKRQTQMQEQMKRPGFQPGFMQAGGFAAAQVSGAIFGSIPSSSPGGDML